MKAEKRFQGKNSLLMAYCFIYDAPSDTFTISWDSTAGNEKRPSRIVKADQQSKQNRVMPNGVSITTHMLVTNCQEALPAKEMTPDLLFAQDQGSSIAGGMPFLQTKYMDIVQALCPAPELFGKRIKTQKAYVA